MLYLSYFLGSVVCFWMIWYFIPLRKIAFHLTWPIRAFIAFRLLIALASIHNFEKDPYYSSVTSKAWRIANKFFLILNPDEG